MTIFKVNIVVCWRRCILAIESKLWRFFYFPLLFSLWFFFFLHNLINTPVIHVHVPEWRADAFFLCEKQPVSTVNGSKSTAHLNRSANVLYSVTVWYTEEKFILTPQFHFLQRVSHCPEGTGGKTE